MKLSKEEKTKLTQYIKNLIKSNSYRCRQNSIYFEIGEYFCACDYVLAPEKIVYNLRLKKREYDDILWEIMNMSDNIEQPSSLRAVGAFAIYGFKIASGGVPYDLDCYTKIEELINNLKNIFSEYIKNNDLYNVIINASDGYQIDELKCLAFISNGEVDRAKKIAKMYISNNIDACFENENKNFYKWLLKKYSSNRKKASIIIFIVAGFVSAVLLFIAINLKYI